MRTLVIGATGTIGSAVANALRTRGHEVIPASRSSEVSVDITDPESIRAMYERVTADGPLDAVVCCAGDAAFGPLHELERRDLERGLQNKLMGQVELVRQGVEHVADGGSMTLTSGVFSQRPAPGVPGLAMVNGAVESFARAAALDLPRGQRVNAVSPGFIHSTAKAMGYEGGDLSADEAAEAYAEFVEGDDNGQVRYPGVEGLG